MEEQKVKRLRRKERLQGRLAVACVTVGSIVVLAALAGSYWISTAFSDKPALEFLVICLPAVFFFSCLFASNALLYQQHLTESQLARAEARSSGARAILISRSFDPAGLAFHPAVWVRNAEYGRHRRDKHSYLNELADSWKAGHLVAIGAPNTRVDLYDEVHELYFQTRETDWQSTFLLVARSARFIWMIPATSQSVMAEMRMLREHTFTAKTIIFMPPQPYQRGLELWAQPYCDPEQCPQQWKETAQHWRIEGCNLPDYDRRGAIFSCNNDFSPRDFLPLDGSMARLGELLPQLLSTIPDEAGPPVSQLVIQLESIESEPPKPARIETFYIP